MAVYTAADDKILAAKSDFERLIARKQHELTSAVSDRARRPQDAFREKSICTFVRARPLLPHEEERGEFNCIVSAGNKCAAANPRFNVRGPADPTFQVKRLDGCFPKEASNEEVYEAIGQPIVTNALAGGVGTIFAYGQTGAGKTYTCNALLQGMAKALFLKEDVRIHVCVVEMLGADTTDLHTGATVHVREDRFSHVHLRGAHEECVKTPGEFLSFVGSTMGARATAATARNDQSSRSHAIVTVRIEFTSDVMKAASVEDGRVYLVDLAGSERDSDRKVHSKERLEESKLINESLSTLKECIKKRGDAGKTKGHLHIPYRRSKLTLYLKDCFELAVRRPFKLATLACVSPLPRDSSQSINTIRYASSLVSVLPPVVLGNDDKDPSHWDRDRCLRFCSKYSKGKTDGTSLLPHAHQSGRDLVDMGESEFVQRLSGHMVPAAAKDMHTYLWKLVADARTRQRRAVLKTKKDSGDQISKAAAQGHEHLDTLQENVRWASRQMTS